MGKVRTLGLNRIKDAELGGRTREETFFGRSTLKEVQNAEVLLEKIPGKRWLHSLTSEAWGGSERKGENIRVAVLIRKREDCDWRR